MNQDKARLIIDAERGRLVAALMQISNSDEQLTRQLKANAEQREEITSRVAAIDDAMRDGEPAATDD